MVSNIEIKKENVLAAYNGASAEQKQLLETLFGKDTFKPQDITERVRTFEDACNVLGSDHPLVDKYYQWADNVEDNDPFIRAVLKLEIITAALNEGWEPHFTAGEWRWIPWFWFYKSREDWENDEDEDWRNEHPYRELGGDWKTEYAASPLRSRITPPGIRMRASALAFALRTATSPRIAARSSPTCGWTSASSARVIT